MIPLRQSQSDEFHIWKPASDFHARHMTLTIGGRCPLMTSMQPHYSNDVKQTFEPIGLGGMYLSRATSSPSQIITGFYHSNLSTDALQRSYCSSLHSHMESSKLCVSMLRQTALSLFLLRYSYPFFRFTNLLYPHHGTRST